MTQELVRDPVCGMEFRPSQASATAEWRDRTYYFCCQACLASFMDDPPRFERREEEYR
jgi:Cu+-exporting ATPase